MTEGKKKNHSHFGLPDSHANRLAAELRTMINQDIMLMSEEEAAQWLDILRRIKKGEKIKCQQPDDLR